MDMDLVASLEKLSRSVTLIPVSLQAPSPSELLPPAKSCAVLCCAVLPSPPSPRSARHWRSRTAWVPYSFPHPSQLQPPSHPSWFPSRCCHPQAQSRVLVPLHRPTRGCCPLGATRQAAALVPPCQPQLPRAWTLAVSSPVGHSRPRSPGHLGMCWLCMSQGVCRVVRLLLADICPNVVAKDREVSAAAARAQLMSTHGDARPCRDRAFC